MASWTVCSALVLAAAPALLAETYSFENDFSPAANSETSVWSYRFQSNGVPNNLARDGSYELLPNPASNLSGIAELNGWSFLSNPVFAGLPMAAKNTSAVEGTDGRTLRVPAGQCTLHPSVAQLVVASWRAPRSGAVRVDFRFADLDRAAPDPADNGILWYVDKGDATGNLAGGSFGSGGESGQQTLTQVSVAEGDRIHFVIDPNGTAPANIYFDSTRLFAEIGYVADADFDFERDFSTAQNTETNTWSYRYQANGTPDNLARDGAYELLPNRVLGSSGMGGVNGWINAAGSYGELPVIARNFTDHPTNNGVSLVLPAGQCTLHPDVNQIVVASWLVPSNGTVRVDYRFSDLDSGSGDGVGWFVDLNTGAGNLASGSFDNGGDSGLLALPYINVQAGDRLNFIVDPNGSIGWDSTRLMARLTYVEPLRLFIARQDPGVRLSWTTSAPPAVVLQAAPFLEGPWDEVPMGYYLQEGSFRVCEERLTNGMRFYRLGLAASPGAPLQLTADGQLGPLAMAQGAPVVMTFKVDGADSSGWFAAATFVRQEQPVADGGTLTRLQWTGPDGLEATCEATRYADFEAVEWVWTLRNTGTAESGLLEGIQTVDVLCRAAAGGSNFVLHAARGGLATPQDYEPLTYDLATQSRVTLRAAGGRSSNLNLPFWNLESGGTGWVFGLGWSGQWKAELERVVGQGVRMRAGMERTQLRLHPGESIRSPRLLALAYQGGSLRGHNLLRRYIYRHVTPLLGGQKPLPAVWSDTWWSSGDGGGNSGSFATETNQAQLLRALGPLGIDYVVMDAGWYGTSPEWWNSVGTWTPRADHFPNGVTPLGPVAAAAGTRFGMWFEPERVVSGTALDQQHPEWLLRAPGAPNLLNLGLPAVREWFINMISNYVATVPLGWFRHDFNMDPLANWQAADTADRVGMTEIRYVEGLYYILDTLRGRFPDVFFEGCASGGRRVDLETIRRNHGYWSSDLFTYPVPNQNQTYGGSFWLPGCYRNETTLDLGSDTYHIRSIYGSSLCVGWDPRVAGFNTNLAIARIAEFKSLRHLFVGDYYPLLPWSTAETVWTGFQFHREDLEEGMAVLFRRSQSAQAQATVTLQGLTPGLTYALTFKDTGAVVTNTGAQLMHPLSLSINSAPGSALLTYKRLSSP